MDSRYGHLKHYKICCVSPLSRVGVVGGGAVVSAEAVGGLVVSGGGGGGVFGGLVGGAVSVGSVGKKRSEVTGACIHTILIY